MKNKFLLLTAAVLFAFTPMLSGSSVTNAKAKTAIHSIVGKSISFQEVQAYMAQFEINIVGMSTITGSENVYARDDRGINYIVYVVNGYGSGWEQVDF